ncbi:MAG TPA: hypothetical protein VM841_01640 [Actinomycetota bacterium]|nr:hypothetical protein [Actinomycetota bacterium]
MAVGVYVACEDPLVADAVTHALSRTQDCFAAPALDGADVVLADPLTIPEHVDAALVVLAATDPVAAARVAIARGADGIAPWPDEPASLARIVCEAAARKAPVARGRVIAVVGARGGAGATTVAAYLAARFARDTLLVDIRGGEAGQMLFAAGDGLVTLSDAHGLAAEPSVKALRAMAAAHASGAPCIFGGPAPSAATPPLVACMRAASPIVVVDGAAPDADATIVVCGSDVGSVRAAAALDATHVVLNMAARGRVRPRQARRALGLGEIFVVPADRRIARAADLGRLARRGPGRRALMRLAARIGDAP